MGEAFQIGWVRGLKIWNIANTRSLKCDQCGKKQSFFKAGGHKKSRPKPAFKKLETLLLYFHYTDHFLKRLILKAKEINSGSKTIIINIDIIGTGCIILVG